MLELEEGRNEAGRAHGVGQNPLVEWTGVYNLCGPEAKLSQSKDADPRGKKSEGCVRN